MLDRCDRNAVPAKGPLKNMYVTTYQNDFTDFSTKYGKNFGHTSCIKYERDPVTAARAGVNILLLAPPVFDSNEIKDIIVSHFGVVHVDIPLGLELSLQNMIASDSVAEQYGYMLTNFPRCASEATHFFHPQAPPSAKLPAPDIVFVIEAPQELIEQQTFNNLQKSRACQLFSETIDDVLLVLSLSRRTSIHKLPSNIGSNLIHTILELIEECRANKLRATELSGATVGTLNPKEKTLDSILPGLDHGTRKLTSTTPHVDLVSSFGVVPLPKERNATLEFKRSMATADLEATRGVLENAALKTTKRVNFN